MPSPIRIAKFLGFLYLLNGIGGIIYYLLLPSPFSLDGFFKIQYLIGLVLAFLTSYFLYKGKLIAICFLIISILISVTEAIYTFYTTNKFSIFDTAVTIVYVMIVIWFYKNRKQFSK